MKTIREIIAEYIPNEDISAEMVDKLYEYKNQRVIDELERLKFAKGIDSTIILYRIKELKQ
tara:strand:- start:792 stop:974 length:183 start_codon:yes stop_codon:yes gene_type:complete